MRHPTHSQKGKVSVAGMNYFTIPSATAMFSPDNRGEKGNQRARRITYLGSETRYLVSRKRIPTPRNFNGAERILSLPSGANEGDYDMQRDLKAPITHPYSSTALGDILVPKDTFNIYSGGNGTYQTKSELPVKLQYGIDHEVEIHTLLQPGNQLTTLKEQILEGVPSRARDALGHIQAHPNGRLHVGKQQYATRWVHRAPFGGKRTISVHNSLQDKLLPQTPGFAQAMQKLQRKKILS